MLEYLKLTAEYLLAEKVFFSQLPNFNTDRTTRKEHRGHKVFPELLVTSVREHGGFLQLFQGIAHLVAGFSNKAIRPDICLPYDGSNLPFGGSSLLSFSLPPKPRLSALFHHLPCSVLSVLSPMLRLSLLLFFFHLHNYHNSGHYTLPCLLFKTQHFVD
jgi:hypothetical protein